MMRCLPARSHRLWRERWPGWRWLAFCGSSLTAWRPISWPISTELAKEMSVRRRLNGGGTARQVAGNFIGPGPNFRPIPVVTVVDAQTHDEQAFRDRQVAPRD